jgi:hypothetical protein
MTVSASLRMDAGAQPAFASAASALRAGTEKAKFKFVLTDEKGDRVATSTREVSTSGFRTEKAEISEFDELLDGASSVDKTKIKDISFGFSLTAETKPKFKFDVDKVFIPEPDISLLRIAALASVVLLRWRTRRA